MRKISDSLINTLPRDFHSYDAPDRICGLVDARMVVASAGWLTSVARVRFCGLASTKKLSASATRPGFSLSAYARKWTNQPKLLERQAASFDALQAHNHYKFSVVWLPVCPQWRTLPRILNTNLLSANRLDANQCLRSQKVKELLAYCATCSQEGEVVDVGQVAFKNSLNLLSNTLFSKDLADPFSDSKVELKEVIWSITTEVGKPNLVDIFSIFEKIDPQGIRRRTTIYFGKLFKLFNELINERWEKKRRRRDEKSDVLEALLDIIAENPEEIDQNYIKSMFLVINHRRIQDLKVAGALWIQPKYSCLLG
uniref:Geraniol 8-hydroxylase-like n=1 Tax=Nicotiana sylvestris TaxID=4096 RepID=A0A1U7XGB2_NICSY|nr:PREDICTED: geraniol 8-hydroxylase-like [Nicotiana sylvestris]